MKRAWGAELAAVLYRCESVIHWVTYYTAQEEGRKAAAQHVRVIPARLLNFGSFEVIVYGYLCGAVAGIFMLSASGEDQTFMQTPQDKSN